MSAYSDRILADGASHYWRLGETAGTSAVDLIGGATGTISGGVTLGQAGALSDGDKAMAFNGTSGQIVTAVSLSIPLTGTIEGWVRYTGAGNYISMWSNRGLDTPGTTRTILCAAITAKAGIYSQHTPENQVVGTRLINDGQWHHVVYVLTNPTVSLYVDGGLDGSGAFTRSAPPDLARPGWIGADAEGNYWPGAIDEVATYPRALTPAEIAAHYALRLATAGGAVAPVPIWMRPDDEGDLMQPYNDWRKITPSDTVDLPELTEALYAGGAGAVAAVLPSGVMPGAIPVAAGAYLPLAVRRVNATGTTATDLWALYTV